MSAIEPETSPPAPSAPAPYCLSFASSMEEIGPEVWATLDTGDQPFVSYPFLHALEASGTVGEATGWAPQHAVLREPGAGNRVLAVVPTYLKYHSWGEFVFDWAWADAYRRYGREYYPKLLTAIPFTPVTGPRLLLSKAAPDAFASTEALRQGLLLTLADAIQELGVSSHHLLFPKDADRGALESAGYLLRKDCQFQWRNRAYGDFNDFLGTFSSAKRKKVKRERRRVQEDGIRFDWRRGDTLDEGTWDQVYDFYASTFLKRGHDPYFPPTLFPMLAERLGGQLQVCLAQREGKPVAAAIFFRDAKTLYGRYWGCAGDYHSLHFETCYYQGIDYCIAEGIERFEPGTQGEHKLSRGFEPTATWSGHMIGEPAFANAIASYLESERNGVDRYMDSADEHLPFRRGAGDRESMR
ncbi:MAG: GNAT family N-acetyltransferase [Pseudomonadota bacterium]